MDDSSIQEFEEVGLKVKGTVVEGIESADIVIDATPKGVGIKNMEIYRNNGKKAILQGGEPHDIVEVSFVAQANYVEALGKNYVRVVSCNTTAMSRVLVELMKVGKIEKVRGVIVRRAADPWEIKRGPIDAIVPSLKIPSHHAPDVKTVIKNLDITTLAVVVPTTRMHLHILNIEFASDIDRDAISEALISAPRIVLLSKKLGIDSTATTIELARDLGRKRNDLYEVIVFEDSVRVLDREVWMMYAVHQEAIVVPENIDAVRAMFGMYDDAMKSIEKTDRSLGIMSRLW